MFDKAACIVDRDYMLEAVIMDDNLDAFMNFHKKNNPGRYSKRSWLWDKEYIVSVCCRAALLLPESFFITEDLKARAKSRLNGLFVG